MLNMRPAYLGNIKGMVSRDNVLTLLFHNVLTLLFTASSIVAAAIPAPLFPRLQAADNAQRNAREARLLAQVQKFRSDTGRCVAVQDLQLTGDLPSSRLAPGLER
eukprot:COSAG01_NODE_1232_length_11111_cov_24.710770_4_plen_105_part_00